MEPSVLTILRHIHQAGRITRRRLSELTGLSASRISALVAQLVERGLVIEEIDQGGLPGRPASRLSVNPVAGCVVGLDIGGRHSRAMVTDLHGRPLDTLVQTTEISAEPTHIPENIWHLVQAICARVALPPEDMAALGIGLQGIVDSRTGIALGWPNTPAWHEAWKGLDIQAALRPHLAHTLFLVEDSVRAMAATAQRFGQAQGSDSLFYVFLGNGIGAALMVEGRLYHGGTGLAGEIGHIAITEDGPLCSCGNRGCLEMLASTAAVLRRVRERLAEPHLVSTLRELDRAGELTLAQLIAAARSGDKLAFQILDETGAFVGRALAIALNLLGPKVVVLGGPLAQEGEIILQAVQREVRLRALEQIARQTRILCDDQGELSGAQGAALLALDALFSSPHHLERLWGHR